MKPMEMSVLASVLWMAHIACPSFSFAFAPPKMLTPVATRSSDPYSRRRSGTIDTTLRMVSADASDLLYQEQEKIIVRRGEFEEEMIGLEVPSIEAPAIDFRGVGKVGGFGGGMGGGGGGGKKGKGKGKGKSKGGGSKKKSGGGIADRAAEGQAYADVLRNDGVVRIDSVLSSKTVDAVRSSLYDLRERADEEVEQGLVKPLERYANVLLRENRRDLTVPLGADAAYSAALEEILLRSPVGATMSALLGEDAVLYELACLMSDPGSQRQVVHPDTPVIPGKEAVLYTCFVALQDVREGMGPTVWFPGTHTKEAHEAFKDGSERLEGESRKDALLRSTPAVRGLLPKGSCAIFDSRLLHCGTANVSVEDGSRALFYFSFKHPSVGYPGNPASIRSQLGKAEVRLGALAEDLEGVGGGNTPLIDKLATTLR